MLDQYFNMIDIVEKNKVAKIPAIDDDAFDFRLILS